MFKKTSLLMVFLLSFCLFVTNVKAITYAAGYCIYNFNFTATSGRYTGESAEVSLKIEQNNEGNSDYFIAYEKVTAKDSSKWENLRNPWGVDHSEQTDATFKKGNFMACPQYAAINDSYHVWFFEENPTTAKKEEHDIITVATVTPDSKIEMVNDDYEGDDQCPGIMNWYTGMEPKESDDDIYCLYSGYFPKKVLGYSTKGGCIKVQLHYKKSTSELEIQDASFLHWSTSPYNKSKDTVVIGSEVKDVLANGVCPGYLGVGPGGVLNKGNFSCGDKRMGIFYSTAGTVKYPDSMCSSDLFPYVPFEVKTVKLVKSIPKGSTTIIDPTSAIRKIGVCWDDEAEVTLINERLADLLKNIVLILRILIPILLNVFGIIDFGKAIFAGDEEQMKKAQAKFIKRLIIGIAIYLIPTVLKLVLGIASKIWPVIDSSLCGII